MKPTLTRLVLTSVLFGACGSALGQSTTPDPIYDRIARIERIPPEERSPADLVQLGRDYRKTGRNEDALTQARAALRQAPASPDALLLLGDLQFQRQQYRQALSTFDRVAQLRPSLAVVQLRRSQTLSAMGLSREAEAASALFQTRSGRVRAATPNP